MSFGHRCIRYVLLLALFAVWDTVHAESKSLVVHDPRPVAKAVERLEALYGLPVTYEDPPYVHESEVADVTDKVRRDQRNLHRVLIPKGGLLSFTYNVPSTGVYPGGGLRQSAAEAADALANMVQSYAASRSGAMFTVTPSNGR